MNSRVQTGERARATLLMKMLFRSLGLSVRHLIHVLNKTRGLGDVALVMSQHSIDQLHLLTGTQHQCRPVFVLSALS